MVLRFLTFDLDPERRELRDRGEPVALSPKAFDVLQFLIAHRDRMVPKTELLEALWPRNVSDAALLKAISLIRKALDNDAQGVIKTYHGLGFRFAPAVTETLPGDGARQGRPAEGATTQLREQRLASVVTLRLCAEGGAPPALAAVLAHVRAALPLHQGALLRVSVDAVSVSFGLETPCEDAARRGLHFACAMAGPGLAIGIDYGAVDLVSSREEAEWTPPGAVERGALALALAGGADEIRLSDVVQAQLGGEIDSTPAGAGHRLTRADQMRAGIPQGRFPVRACFVGRVAERAFLDTARESVAQGTGKAVLLSGPAGIGKTRLVKEFLRARSDTDLHAITVQCLPAFRNSPFAAIRDLLRAPVLESLDDLALSDLDAALLADLLSDAAVADPLLAGLSDKQRRQRGLDILDQILTRACRRQALLLVFEDIHWIDTRSREYLDALLGRVDRMRLMVLMTTRPTTGRPLCDTVLQLAPLDHRDSLTLLHDRLDALQIDEALAALLVRRAAGNPFFIEELALAAQAGADPARELPDTVQAVIAARIAALAPDLRELVYVLAVIGPPAPVAVAMRLLGLSPVAAEDALARLVAEGFVQPQVGGYAFRHMLINDVACTLIAPEARRQLHGEIARILEDEAETLSPLPETLAWHHQQAGAPDRAIPFWAAASRAALNRGALDEAIGFARSGLALLQPDLPDAGRMELNLQLCLAPALAARLGFAAAEVGAAYARAERLNGQVGTVRTRVRVLVGLWIHTWVAGRLTESLGFADELLAIARKTGDPMLALQGHASAGQVLMHKGALDKALAHLAEGVAIARAVPPATPQSQNTAVACAAYCAWVHALSGRRDRCLEMLAACDQFAGLHENPYAVAIQHALCAEPCMLLGDVGRCLAHADQAVAVSREHDFAFWLGTGLVMRGWALGRRRDFAAAFAAIDEGIAVFEATGARVQLANWQGQRAETLLTAGQPQAALQAAEQALRHAEQAEDPYFTPRIHATAAAACRLLGDGPQADWHRDRAETLLVRFAMAPGVLGLEPPA